MNPEVLFSGVRGIVDPAYNGRFWAVRGENPEIAEFLARTYAGRDENVLQLVVPKDSKTLSFDAKGRRWFDIDLSAFGIEHNYTNDLADFAFQPPRLYDRVNIDNVADYGEPFIAVPQSRFYSLSKTIPQTILQNDVIINANVPRKSVVGGNGDFNLDKLNHYEKDGGKLK